MTKNWKSGLFPLIWGYLQGLMASFKASKVLLWDWIWILSPTWVPIIIAIIYINYKLKNE